MFFFVWVWWALSNSPLVQRKSTLYFVIASSLKPEGLIPWPSGLTLISPFLDLPCDWRYVDLVSLFSLVHSLPDLSRGSRALSLLLPSLKVACAASLFFNS